MTTWTTAAARNRCFGAPVLPQASAHRGSNRPDPAKRVMVK